MKDMKEMQIKFVETRITPKKNSDEEYVAIENAVAVRQSIGLGEEKTFYLKDYYMRCQELENFIQAELDKGIERNRKENYNIPKVMVNVEPLPYIQVPEQKELSKYSISQLVNELKKRSGVSFLIPQSGNRLIIDFGKRISAVVIDCDVLDE